MFEVSKNILITLEIFQESKIYTIDNFYENPNSVLNFFLNNVPNLHKSNETPSYNGIYFEDRRHNLTSFEIKQVYSLLSFICGQPAINDAEIVTNAAKFLKDSFNNYQNNYWWPHRDMGYNGIVYFNHGDEVSGTNLYQNLNPSQEPPNYPEHYKPWRHKKNYKLVKTLYPRYNRLVLFDGKKFFHGMNICNDEYFGENYRLNQVFFFKEEYDSNY